MNNISNLGLSPLSTEKLKIIAKDFEKQCSLGQKTPPEGTLKMYPSYIKKPSSYDKLVNESVLAVDIGGSNLRIGIYHIDDSKEVTLHPGTEVLVTENRPRKTTISEFIEVISSFIKTYLEKYSDIEFDRIGIVFSFGGKIIKENNFFDISREGKADRWSKGFYIKDSSINITKKLRKNLLEKSLVFSKWIGLNDVIALHLASPVAISSLIVGTGFNIGVLSENRDLFNTQSPSFINDVIEQSLSQSAKMLLEEINQDSSNKLKFATEVNISGGYLHRLMVYNLLFLCEENKELLSAISKLGSKSLSLFIDQDYEEFKIITDIELPEFKQQLLTKIATLIRGRSTDLVSAQLAGAVKYSLSKSKNDSNEITIAADGSVIREMPDYKTIVEEKTSKLLDDTKVKIVIIENSALKGAAVAALIL